VSSIRIVESGSRPWSAVRDVASDELKATMSEGELAARSRVHHPGGHDELQMFEVALPAGAEINAHAHLEDEIIYVLEGEMRLGARTLGPGSSVYIEGDTLYGFRAGPAGLRFLNFRSRQDTSFVAKAEFVARRSRGQGSAGTV
jgi:quercetin dioxygenase-like cupin family protein